MYSPLSEPDILQFSSLLPSFPVTTVKPESMACINPLTYTPQVMSDNIWLSQNVLDNNGCSDNPTYLNLPPAEIVESAAESLVPDYLTLEDNLSRCRIEDDLLTNNNKDEGYASPEASLHSLTPPSISGHYQQDSANESGNSSDVTVPGAYATKDQYRVPEPFIQAQPSRSQCAMCGRTVDIAHSRTEATGLYLCYDCYLISNQAPINVKQPSREKPTPKRARKRQSATANAKNLMCKNCFTESTTLWRRNQEGEPVCNACGLYTKLHNIPRPLSMRKDTIQTRRRKPRNTETRKRTIAKAVSSTSIPSTVPSTSNMTNRVIPQPMVIPSRPPPPYSERFATIENSGAYQVLPSMGSIGFYNGYAYENNYTNYTIG